MFDKILIANRGEIACRIMRTARRMGISTVAVYSDADADALHVLEADEAVLLGPPPAAESYLLIDKLIAAIRQTGAQAVHPGYGFLSERAEFAEALAAEGVAFIGPPVGAIRAMGDKIESKKLADKAGVSTVPGHLGVIETPDQAVKIARGVGFPVMIKASAGGGGKGMRVARSAEEVADGFRSSMNEARSAFGDDRVFIEKFVVSPRHIEIQVLGDTHGNCIYLHERECSIQRRNQKVIEEAPSPFLDAETRRKMGEQAVALAKAVDYCSAGTVEFIVDADRNFYFLEMNTRLQVEHPVTELITGVDLVEEMIRVAAGEKLRMTQGDVPLEGWAIEGRVYAEDPYRNFLPSIGRLKRYRPPAEGRTGGGEFIRNDTGVQEGSEISIYYDPMIAKLCAWGADRPAAIAAMRDALDTFEIEGLGANLPFLSAVLDHARFHSGEISTAFIAEEYPDSFSGAALSDEAATRMALLAIGLTLIEEERRGRLTGRLRAAPPPPRRDWTVAIGDADHTASLVAMRANAFAFENGAEPKMVLDWRPGERVARAQFGGGQMTVNATPALDGWRLRWRGVDVVASARSPEAAALARLMPKRENADSGKALLCPMPGLITRIDVAVGDRVEAGQIVAVVEAMKMENVLRAERAGAVSEIHAKPGDSLAVDEVIMEFE